MTLLTLGAIGFASALVFLAELLVRRKEVKGWDWLMDFSGVAAVLGILGVSLVAWVYLPTWPAGLNVWGGYKPHIAFIVLWCPFALLVLRPRFKGKMILAFALLYGLSEVFFNTIALAAMFVYDTYIIFFFLTDWQLFFVLILASVVSCYLAVRPRFVPSPALLVFVAWSLIWLAMRLPSVDDAMLGVPSKIPWDIAWQLNMFMFGTWVMKPRSKN